ncbi:MAG: ABC transporter permease [Pseudomonadota bacterium]
MVDQRRGRHVLTAWRGGVVLLAAVLALPVLVIATSFLWPSSDTWNHLRQTVLHEYVTNSLLLMLGVGTGTLFIGTATAWLCSTCHFPGRRFFEWALLLPMAMPAYIIAYTYTGMLDSGGPVQGVLRAASGWSTGDYWFPEIRSLWGAAAMLTLVLYPYVYLLARSAFLEQSASALNVARTLGLGPWSMFRRAALPLARPAIVAGLTLTLMETLADYGTVQYFGVPTFTTGIFRTWFGLGDINAAAQLSAVLMSFVLILVVLERASRRRARYHHHGTWQPGPSFHLGGWRAAAAVVACLLPLLLGFILPSLQLLGWTIEALPRLGVGDFAVLTSRSLGLAATAAGLTVLCALFLAYGYRLAPSKTTSVATRIAGIGYAVPGMVIAVGVVIPFAWFDNTIDSWLRDQFGISSGLLLSGTLAALIFAYVARFLAVALNSVESGLGRVKSSMDDAARSMGLRPLEVLRRVHMPLIRGSLLTAGLLVFVDVLKELPATLVLRPFDFNTLAVRAFELASDERLRAAAPPALTIVLAGLVPVILLSRAISRARESHD